MESVKIGEEKKKLFRWPEWATLSSTCFDKNSLPIRVLNFALCHHCNDHAVAVTKLSLSPAAFIVVTMQVPLLRGAIIATTMQLPSLSSGVYITPLPPSSFYCSDHAGATTQGWISHQATHPPLGVTRAFLLLHSQLRKTHKGYLCAPRSDDDEPDSPWGLLRLVTFKF